jgi:hypothetical protein
VVMSDAGPVLPASPLTGPAHRCVPHSQAIEHICKSMKTLPGVYSVRWIGNRWWIEARNDHPHRRELDCRPVPFPSSSSLSLKTKEEKRDKYKKGDVWPAVGQVRGPLWDRLTWPAVGQVRDWSR